jgi:hypothetical protein
VAPGRAGLIFGYGAIVESAIEPGIRRLADVVTAARSRASRAAGAG